ncbi:MAG: membrane protein insertion efficiency factor YidD [Alphaproteobacteria bacterium]
MAATAASEPAPRRGLGRLAALPLVGLVRGYQLFVSPVLPMACRFQPTCSNYAIEAITRHGPLRGSWLAARRIARCHPLGGHGYDPVPAPRAAGLPTHTEPR